MKNFSSILSFWVFEALVLFLSACGASRAPNAVPPLFLTVDQIDLEELEVGNFLEEWDHSKPLELGTLDLSKCGVFTINDSLGRSWVKKIASSQRIVAGEAVNDTLIRQPMLEGIKASTVLLKVLYPQSKTSVVQKFTNVTFKDASIRRLTMSQRPESDPNYLEYKNTLASAEKVQKKVRAAEKLRAEKAKDSPLHAAKMLEPNLTTLDSAVAAIILHLKQYKPNGGSVDLNTFNLQIEAINKETMNMVNGMTNSNSAVRELKVVFASASYDIDIARNGAVLNDYLSDLITDLSSAKPIDTKPVSIKVNIAAYADLQNINDTSLQRSLSERYDTICNGSQECLNKLLSKARAEAVRDWFDQAISRETGPGTLINVTIKAEGEGWGVPRTYQGKCPDKNCEDRRIALISRVIF